MPCGQRNDAGKTAPVELQKKCAPWSVSRGEHQPPASMVHLSSAACLRLHSEPTLPVSSQFARSMATFTSDNASEHHKNPLPDKTPKQQERAFFLSTFFHLHPLPPHSHLVGLPGVVSGERRWGQGGKSGEGLTFWGRLRNEMLGLLGLLGVSINRSARRVHAVWQTGIQNTGQIAQRKDTSIRCCQLARLLITCSCAHMFSTSWAVH